MVGTMLFILGVGLLFIAGYLEIANLPDSPFPGRKLAKRIIGTQKPNLILYWIIVLLIVPGVYVGLLKAPPFWFLLTIAVLMFLISFTFSINHYRFDTATETPEEIVKPYFETIESRDPEGGIDYIIEYIQNPKWGVPERHLRIFLTRMAKRDDEYGRIASKRMAELGISNDESS
ncbi:MAG: hypothetical protein ACOC38_02750 [Promethearchaeia archaeon]